MSKKMERLQFYIAPEANKQLDIISKKIGVSKAELVREGVDKVLKEKLPLEDDPAYKLIGLINEKNIENKVAENHDYYLYGKGRSDNE